ncbi:MAG: serine/threonine protein kinase, partial [Acidobacteria bacterium]|nr:serine/threonine protein kinase [Acidobacteriota bacterium]
AAPPGASPPPPGRVTDFAPGDRVGPYRIVRTLGAGSMGTVFLAEQEEPVRRLVAMKFMFRSSPDPSVIARLQAEKQALALMNHSGIARIYDAGATPEGLPYFVMEYIAGEPLTAYCDNRKLPLAERLRLMIRICQAVQHAHQKGIIHRDLKPSNILVHEEDGRPVPTIIDFGIAKAVQQEQDAAATHDVTQTGGVVGTPAYMSPEQITLGEDVDTRTDIYALGMTLYELLTGRGPFESEGANLYELLFALLEKAPPPPAERFRTLGAERAEAAAAARRTSPRALQQALAGDLRWIVNRALQKQKQDRYASASELAADLERHLQRQPVLAAPPAGYRAGWYRFRQFVRRHTVGVAASAAILLLLSGITAVSVRYAVVTSRQARQIQTERDRAETITRFLLDIFRFANPYDARGGEITVRQLLDRASRRIRFELDAQPQLKASLLEAVASTYAGLGLYAPARIQQAEALRIVERELGRGDETTAAARGRLADIELKAGNLAAAERQVTAARHAMEARGLTHDARYAAILQSLALLRKEQGQYAPATELLERAVAINRAAGPAAADAVLDNWHNLANVYIEQGDYGRAGELMQRVLDEKRRVYRRAHPSLAQSINDLAVVWLGQGEFAAAEPLARESVAMFRQTLGDENPELAHSLNNLASVLANQGKLAEAEACQREALRLHEAFLGPDHYITGKSIYNLGFILDGRNDAEAERLYRQAVELLRRTVGPGHVEVATALHNLAANLDRQGKYAAAEAASREALAIFGQAVGEAHPLFSVVQRGLARILLDRGRLDEAGRLLREAAARLETAFGPDHWRVAQVRNDMGEYFWLTGNRVQGEAMLRESYEALRDKKGPEDYDTRIAAERLARVLAATGRPKPDR